MDVILNDDNKSGIAPENSKPLISQASYELNFLNVLGYEPEKPPLGDFLRQYHRLEGQWLVASPIYWQATHNDAFIIAANNELDLNEEEAHKWFNEVATFLKEEKISLYYHNAYTWLIKVDNKPSLNSPPVQLIMRQSLMPFIEKMDTTLYWQRLFTELQMFLSNHAYNNLRNEKPSINGLWLYGEGQFSLNSKRPILTNDAQLLLVFASQVKSLDFTQVINNKSIVLLKNSNELDNDKFTHQLQGKSVNWFWNNIAYQTVKQHWWNKLWRGLVNAN
ncbi:hypothetical protein ACNVED_07890 [Legionella sp. D16C41]|uniref:hypothetical protein n=1 Tax=Legionella sp. D16C41 TaxID=3402688 RepID=UPI003AF811FD